MAFLCSIDGKKHPVACKSFPFIKNFENDGRMFIPNETQSKISVSENSTRAECNCSTGLKYTAPVATVIITVLTF